MLTDNGVHCCHQPGKRSGLKSRYEQAIIRGEPARYAHHEPGYYRLPPDWSGGSTSIFASQQREDAVAAM